MSVYIARFSINFQLFSPFYQQHWCGAEEMGRKRQEPHTSLYTKLEQKGESVMMDLLGRSKLCTRAFLKKGQCIDLVMYVHTNIFSAPWTMVHKRIYLTQWNINVARTISILCFIKFCVLVQFGAFEVPTSEPSGMITEEIWMPM